MALSFYSLVQFVPRPERDERVNIGLIVISPELRYADVVFDDPQKRARRLVPGADLSFLEDVRAEFSALAHPGPQLTLAPAERLWSRERLIALHEQAGNVVQISAPRAALTEDPAALLDELRQKFLGDIMVRTRARSARAIRGAIRRAFEAIGRGEDLKPDVPVQGKHDRYVLDFALENGRIRQLIDSISLLQADEAKVHSDIHAAGYRFFDIREAKYDAGLALVVAAPTATHEFVQLASGVVQEFDAELVLERNIDSWAASLKY